MHCRSPLVRILYSGFLLVLVLTACSIEGGVPEVPPTEPVAPLPRPTDSVAAAALATRNDTWKIGLLDQPKDLYPYQPDSNSQRIAAPILELLFPSPILAFNYGYTTTGVLAQIPTIENGGAEVRKSDVYLDATGNITTTATQVVTQVDQLVVTYRWNPDLHWSDGQPVTAADSVFAYELAKKTPPNDEAVDRLAATLRYEVVDEHTTRAILRPDVTGSTYFLNYWTPLPQHILKNMPPDQLRKSDFAHKPIGYGPYAIQELAHGEMQMMRNQYYFGSSPKTSHLTISFLPNIDLLR